MTMKDNFSAMTIILFDPKIEKTVILLVEKLIHRTFDNSNRKEMKKKGVFRKIRTMKYSKLYNMNSNQDDNEIQIVVVLAPLRHDHELLSFLPALLLFLFFFLVFAHFHPPYVLSHHTQPTYCTRHTCALVALDTLSSLVAEPPH